MAVLRQILPHLPPETLTEFEQLTSTQDKFSYVWNMPLMQKGAEKVQESYHGKNDTKANDLRLLGNKLFQKKGYKQALKAYTSALSQAEQLPSTPRKNGYTAASTGENGYTAGPTGENGYTAASTGENGYTAGPTGENGIQKNYQLPLIYGNRSAVLFHLERYNDSLVDIQRAFASDYPAQLCHKLYERQAKCYLKLKHYQNAIAAFREALAYIEQLGVDEKQKQSQKTTIENQLKNLENNYKNGTKASSGNNIAIKPSNAFIPECPEVEGTPHKIFPNAYEDFTIDNDDFCGRLVRASEDISGGEVLMIDEPYSKIQYPQFNEYYCNDCLAVCDSMIPCRDCSSIMYCSEDCRDQAWSLYHKYECKVMEWLHPDKAGQLAHLALRTTAITRWDTLKIFHTLIASGTMTDNVLKGINESNVYDSDYNSTFHLVTHQNKRPVDLDFWLTALSCYLMRLLKVTGYVDFLELTSNEEILLGAATLHHLYVIQCNAITISAMKETGNFHTTKPIDTGLGIYSAAALINHSCDPDVDFTFFGAHCVCRVTRDIPKGKEITVGYGYSYCSHSLADRRNGLLAQYLFECGCIACTEQWPKEPAGAVPTFKCLCCEEKLDISSQDDLESIVCKSCDTEQNMKESLELLSESHEKYSVAVESATSGDDITSALPILSEHLTAMQRLLCQPWREYVNCHAIIVQCYRLQANLYRG